MRVNKKITKEKMVGSVIKLSTSSLKKCIKISMENSYVDNGAERVNYLVFNHSNYE